MYWLIIGLLVGINFAPFAFVGLDIWAAQFIWVQIMTVAMIAWMNYQKTIRELPKNIPIIALLGYTFLQVIVFSCISSYDSIFYFHFLCLLMGFIIYKVIVQYLNIDEIFKVVNVLKYVFIGSLILCVLQNFGLSQFFQMFGIRLMNNPVVGFIGNPTHLSGLIAGFIPLFLYKNDRESWLAIGLSWLILLFLTGTTRGEVAISGIIVGFLVMIYHFWNTNRRLTYFFLFGFLIIGLVTFSLMTNYQRGMFLHDNGRLELWGYYMGVFKQMPITGQGIGSFVIISEQSIRPAAKHLHMEYFQMLIELGIIGFLIVMAMIKNFFSINLNSKEAILFKSMVLAWLISACFNYPMHLWLASVYAIFAYAGLTILKAEDENGCFN